MAQHDQGFKNLILDYLRAALEFFAGVEVGILPKGAKLTPLREERLKEWLGERGSILDVAVKVEFPNGERETIVFCIEHNSRDVKNILKRHALYCIKMSIEHETDRIVPVAIFPEARGRVREAFKFAGDHGVYMEFRCITVKLKKLDARRFEASKNIVARICMPFMKSSTKERLKTLANSYEGLKELEPDVWKRRKYFEFLQQCARLEHEEKEFQAKWVKGSSFEEDYMTTYEHAVMEGKKEGAKGMANLVLKMFLRGKISDRVAREQLEELVQSGEITREIANSVKKQIRSN